MRSILVIAFAVLFLILSNIVPAEDSSAVMAFKTKHPGWIVTWDESSSRHSMLYGPGLALEGFGVSRASDAAIAFVKSNNDLFYASGELSVENDIIVSSEGNIREIVALGQTYSGIPVFSGYSTFFFSEGLLAFVKNGLYSGIQIGIAPSISSEQAVSAAKSHAISNLFPSRIIQKDPREVDGIAGKPMAPDESERPKGAKPIDASAIRELMKIISESTPPANLVILPYKLKTSLEFRLAYEIRLPLLLGEKPEEWTYFVDANSGKVLYRYDRVRFLNVDGTVIGEYYPNDPAQQRVQGFFGNETVQLDSHSTTTSSLGFYSFTDLPLGTYQLSSELAGRYADVSNAQQPDSLHSAAVGAGTHDWNWPDDDQSYKKEEENAYYHANIVHDFFSSREAPFNLQEMNYVMQVNVNLNSICNAFANGNSINFFMAGEWPGWGFCESTALGRDIIYHEYTHNVQNLVYGNVHLEYWDEQGGMMEGWSDYFAATITDDPVIGENVFPEPIRYVNNSLRYPDDYDPEPHAAAGVFEGALWDMRTAIGQDRSDRTVMLGMQLKPLDFTEALTTILVADDDNGDLTDGTPNIDAICYSFWDRHGLAAAACAGHTQTPIAVISDPEESSVLSGAKSISGIAAGSPSGFQSFSVTYTDENGQFVNDGITLQGGGLNQVLGGNLAEWDTSFTTSRSLKLRLNVTDQVGQESIYDVGIEIKNNFIEVPRQFDRLSSNTPSIDIIGYTDPYNFASYELFYRGPATQFQWRSQEITLRDGGTIPVQHGVIGSLSPALITDRGLYQIKLLVHRTGGRPDDSATIFVTFDPAISSGWPVTYTIPTYPCPSHPETQCYNDLGKQYVVTDDLDGDGNREIVFGATANDPGDYRGYTKIFIYGYDGALRDGWPKILQQGYRVMAPAIGDVDGDGVKEIVFVTDDEVVNYVHAMHADGSEVAGYPLSIPITPYGYAAWVSVSLRDLNGDNADEIGLALSDSVFLFSDGNVMAGWPKLIPDFPVIWYGTINPVPVLALLNDAQGPRILLSSVYHNGDFYSITSTWDREGNLLPGWPIQTSSMTGNIAVGNLGNSGDAEIVVSEHGLSVYSPEGIIESGWPQLQELTLSAESTMGDANGDGIPEIAASAWVPGEGYFAYLFSNSGVLLPGWPQRVGWYVYDWFVFSDVNGDGHNDVLATSGNQIHAWDYSGSVLPGFPKELNEPFYYAPTPPLFSSEAVSGGPAKMLADVWASNGVSYIYSWDILGDFDEYAKGWPTFQHDSQHTGDFSFNQPQSPSISSVHMANVGPYSADILWDTDVASNSTVVYSLNWQMDPFSIAQDSAMVTDHAIPLSPLTPSTTYYYYVRSCNDAGCSSDGNYSFRTAPRPPLGGSPLLVATVKPIVQRTTEGGGLKVEGAGLSGFANMAQRSSVTVLVTFLLISAAWFFYDRRRNTRRTRMKNRRRR
ncbi:MAG: FG-GAP-like repeat-containing protein [Candidatus Micrarchaeota archaeon]